MHCMHTMCTVAPVVAVTYCSRKKYSIIGIACGPENANFFATPQNGGGQEQVRAIPEIVLGGGCRQFFCPVGGGCFVDNVSEGSGVTCPGGQGIFDP